MVIFCKTLLIFGTRSETFAWSSENIWWILESLLEIVSKPSENLIFKEFPFVLLKPHSFAALTGGILIKLENSKFGLSLCIHTSFSIFYCTVEDKEITLLLVRRDQLIQEMRQMLAEFYCSVSTQYMILINKYKQEKELALDKMLKERKASLGVEQRRRAELERKGQKVRECKNKKLFLEDSVSLWTITVIIIIITPYHSRRSIGSPAVHAISHDCLLMFGCDLHRSQHLTWLVEKTNERTTEQWSQPYKTMQLCRLSGSSENRAFEMWTSTERFGSVPWAVHSFRLFQHGAPQMFLRRPLWLVVYLWTLLAQ